jgi:hypothetical protein
VHVDDVQHRLVSSFSNEVNTQTLSHGALIMQLSNVRLLAFDVVQLTVGAICANDVLESRSFFCGSSCMYLLQLYHDAIVVLINSVLHECGAKLNRAT